MGVRCGKGLRGVWRGEGGGGDGWGRMGEMEGGKGGILEFCVYFFRGGELRGGWVKSSD